MEPPAKRSKRIQQRKSSQTNETNSPSLLDQIRGCIREEMPAIVRAVVQEVTLPSSRPATSASTSSQNEPEIQTSNTPGADSATQATFPRPADMAIGSILDQSPGTCNSSNSISRPLGALVDQKIKAKIWADEYIELNSIIHKEQHDQFQMVERDGVMVFIKAKVGGNKFSSLAQWNNAFHIFVSVYCEKKPDSATSLMKYANIVNKLADQAGLNAAISYDKNFREWRALDATSLPWQQLNSELYQQALGTSVQQKLAKIQESNSHPFRDSSPPKWFCYNFNNNRGQCTREQCNFPHICQKCGGNHHKGICLSAKSKRNGYKSTQFARKPQPKPTGTIAAASKPDATKSKQSK